MEGVGGRGAINSKLECVLCMHVYKWYLLGVGKCVYLVSVCVCVCVCVCLCVYVCVCVQHEFKINLRGACNIFVYTLYMQYSFQSI